GRSAGSCVASELSRGHSGWADREKNRRNLADSGRACFLVRGRDEEDNTEQNSRLSAAPVGRRSAQSVDCYLPGLLWRLHLRLHGGHGHSAHPRTPWAPDGKTRMKPIVGLPALCCLMLAAQSASKKPAERKRDPGSQPGRAAVTVAINDLRQRC